MHHHRTSPKVFARARELRQEMTTAERKLWSHLRAHRLNGLHFRRQHALGQYIVDFCCLKKNLIIEVDGSPHLEQEAYDLERTAWLNEQGFRVLRFTNHEVIRNTQAVMQAILDAMTPSQPPPSFG